jgi:hypothetical protein
VAATAPAGLHLQGVRTLERSASRRLVQLSSFLQHDGLPPITAAWRPDSAALPASRDIDTTPRTLVSSADTRRWRAKPLQRIPVERIWSTLLALSVLEELDSCWQVDEEDDAMATIVDRGRAFLKAQSRADRRLRKLLASGELAAAAARARREWKAIQAHNVGLLRDTDIISRFNVLTHIQRGSARVVRSMMTDHSTFATFLDTEGYIMRWQRFMILMTLVGGAGLAVRTPRRAADASRRAYRC